MELNTSAPAPSFAGEPEPFSAEEWLPEDDPLPEEETAPEAQSGAAEDGDADGTAGGNDGDAEGTALRDQVGRLQLLFPEVREIPEPVAQAAGQGVDLVTAYLAWRERERTALSAAAQKQKTKGGPDPRRAPVRGVTGGDSSAPRRKSPFEAGFDAGMGWG